MANKQNTSTTAEKASFLQGLRPSDPSIETYLGLPWTKHYDEIVPKYNLKNPTISDLDYYSKNFGLDTSVASLKNKFDALTKQEFAQKNAEFRTSEDQYYKNMIQQNAQYQDAIQQASSEALRAGASRGMQFANQFAAQNVLAEQNSDGALDLATQRNNLKSQEAEAYTQNAIEAEEVMRNLKFNILGQAVADRANEVQRYAADAQLAATDATLRTNNYQYNMTKEYERLLNDQKINSEDYATLLQVLAQMRGQDMSFLGTKYNVDNAKSNYYGGTKGSSNYYNSNITPEQFATIDDAAAKIDALVKSGNPADQNKLNKLLVDYAPYFSKNSKYSYLYDKEGNPNFRLKNPWESYKAQPTPQDLPTLAPDQQWDFSAKYTDKFKK
jgi:hypothetical protein